MLALAAVLLVAAATSAAALFEAPEPGAPLAPVGGAEDVVQLLQGSRSILWTSLTGPVASYRVEGWPTEIDGNELGGPLVMVRPSDPGAGVIDIGERPRSVSFEIGD